MHAAAPPRRCCFNARQCSADGNAILAVLKIRRILAPEVRTKLTNYIA
jgi:hypothetical protein